jgi:hypothetical protein
MRVRDICRVRSLRGVVGAAALASGALAVVGVVTPNVSGATISGPAASKTFAGYGATLSGSGSNTVFASFTVPTLDCATTPSTASTLAEDAGLFGGVGTKAFAESAGVVAEQCKSGKAEYAAAAIAGKKIGLATFLPAVGDTVHVSSTESPSGSTVTITDVTTGKTFTETGTGVAAQGAVVGLQPRNATSEIPTFATVGFTATLNGAALGATAKAFNLQSGSTVKITTSSLGAGSPSAFTETFAHN